MQRLSAEKRSHSFSFGNWGVGSALLNTRRHLLSLTPGGGSGRVGHHRRDVRVLPTHPTLETKKSQQIKLNTTCKNHTRHMRSHSQHCYLFVGFVNRITGCFETRTSYAYNPSSESYHEPLCSNVRRVDA